MNKAIISNRIYLNNSPDLQETIVEKLTYKIPPNYHGGYPTVIKTWLKISEDVIAIPKARTDLIPDHYTVVEKTALPDTNEIELNYELREDQQAVVDAIDNHAIINAKPGWGKTFTGAALYNKFQTKTLILAHTSLLAKQWVDHFKNHSNINPGYIGGGKFNTEPDIVVGLIQSVNKCAEKIAKTFGLVIVDECHHCPATTFTKTLNSLKNTYNIGLSATLERVDKKHVILKDFFGTNVISPIDDNRLDPIVRVINSPVAIPGEGRTPWHTRVTELYLNEEYRSLISFICKLKAKEGHKVLCLADRTDFLDEMHDRDKENSVVIHSKISEDREELLNLVRSGEKSTIYGGSKIFSEGVSENYLSCVVLAYPISNRMSLEQAVSRVLRKHENKLTPEIIDIKFPHNIGNRQFNARNAVYVTEGWKVFREKK